MSVIDEDTQDEGKGEGEGGKPKPALSAVICSGNPRHCMNKRDSNSVNSVN